MMKASPFVPSDSSADTPGAWRIVQPGEKVSSSSAVGLKKIFRANRLPGARWLMTRTPMRDGLTLHASVA